MAKDKDNIIDPTDIKKIELYKAALENETRLHWTRNNYFLLTSSILLVVIGLLEQEVFHFYLGILGTAVNVIWVLIQDRSSRYIGKWKSEISTLEKKIEAFSIYPEGLGGIQMRYIGYALPLPFIFIWLVVIWISLDPSISLSEDSKSILEELLDKLG